jgi:hypothetical protein
MLVVAPQCDEEGKERKKECARDGEHQNRQSKMKVEVGPNHTYYGMASTLSNHHTRIR